MPKQILVVEDEQIVARDIQQTLQSLGYTVPAIADTGEAAVQKAEELRPDLVLMDIQLRDSTDGIEAARIIRSRWDIPAVYLTAHADPATLQRAKITEPFGYVLKPFEQRDLHTTIEMALYKHETERKLRASERWLTVTLSSIGDGVIATDTTGRIVFMNAIAQKLTGWTSQFVGRPLGEVFRILNEHTRQPVEDPVARVLAQGVVVGLANHTLLVAHDGVERPIDDSAAPIQVPGGELLGAVLVFRDITERRRLEVELEQRADDLARADRHKDEFLAVLGHELRTPLACICNGAELLCRLDPSGNEATEVRETIGRQAAQMRHIVDDLLDVTRVTHGKIVLKPTKLDIVSLVRQAVEDQRRSIEGQGGTLRLEVPVQPICCEGDATRLAQIMANLLTNAAKFLAGPGEIVVSVKPDAERQRVAILVRDTGIGMDPPTLRAIFQPFVQAMEAPDGNEAGLGLGLALVKGLVELHGGSVTAASAGVGQGSEFVVELPTCPEVPAGAQRSDEARRSAVRRRVLLIDDQRDSIHLMRRMLEHCGHEVLTARDGASGLEMARSGNPDIVLCDIGLPGISGYDIAARIRSEPTLKHLYLVAVTGYGQQADRDRARKAGFDNHVTKPVSIAALAELVSQTPRFQESD